MATSVGELFVNIGVKGADKTIGAIKSVGDGMKGIASMSLEAKAAILAALYALDKIAESSLNFGTSIQNLSVLTGENGEVFQRWGKAAEQAGVKFDDATSSIVAMQKIMAIFQTKHTLPDGLQFLAEQVPGGLDLNRMGSDLNYMLGFVQRAFHAHLPPAVLNQLMSELGWNQGAIIAGKKGAFDPSNLSRMPIESNKQIQALADINKEQVQMSQKWQKLSADLTAEHGGGLMYEIGSLSDAIIFLIRELDKFFVWVENKFGIGPDSLKDKDPNASLPTKLNNILKAIPGSGLLEKGEDRVKALQKSILELPSRNLPGPMPKEVNNHAHVTVNAPGATRDDAHHIGHVVRRHTQGIINNQWGNQNKMRRD
jgi:hypothetical protein